MFGWLSKRDQQAPEPTGSEALERAIAEGNRLEAAGDRGAAKRCYETALAMAPANARAQYHLGALAYAEGSADEAQRLLRRALQVRPEMIEARAVLFHILEAAGDLEGAVAELAAALRVRPDWTEALYNYGTTLMALKRDAEAETTLRRVLALNPDFAVAYRMLGGLLHRQGRIDELLDVLRLARERRPDDLELESFELLSLNFSEGISEEALFRRHRAFGERLERAVPPRFRWQADPGAAQRRLRVGYVSGDFHYHPVGQFMLPVLERRDAAAFQIHCYAVGTRRDNLTRQLAAAADVWRDCDALSESALADLVVRDEVDILVDLAGHSGISRLGVFAQQPAPVQASWLGYLNTTGLRRIQYRITDGYCDPPRLAQAFHTERLVALPHSQWCYRPFLDTGHAMVPPFETSARITFGSFNQAAKLSGATRRLWAEILRRLPGARLLVAGIEEGPVADKLRRDFANAGVAADRLTLAPFLPVKDYLALYDRVDIALDPMPYSGGTTTCDSLWMGVPVLTLPGGRSASRSAASVLTTIGLSDWIASSADDYVSRATAFAGDAGLLRSLRRSLRDRMRSSPLMDEAGFTQALELIYRELWIDWCNGRGALVP